MRCLTLYPFLCASLLSLAPSLLAEAQETLPVAAAQPSAVPASISEAALRAVGDRLVLLQWADGRELTGRILSVEAEQLIIMKDKSGEVLTLPRAQVVAIKVVVIAPTPVASAPIVNHSAPLELPAAKVVAPSRQRIFAIELGLSPSLMLDVEAGLFHGFTNLGILVPMVTNGAMVPFSVGLGVAAPVSERLKALKLDIFTHLNVVGMPTKLSESGISTQPYLAVGVGLGLHYTFNQGLTLGFTIPILGYGFVPGDKTPDALAGFLTYLWTSGASLPAFHIGYRF